MYTSARVVRRALARRRQAHADARRISCCVVDSRRRSHAAPLVADRSRRLRQTQHPPAAPPARQRARQAHALRPPKAGSLARELSLLHRSPADRRLPTGKPAPEPAQIERPIRPFIFREEHPCRAETENRSQRRRAKRTRATPILRQDRMDKTPATAYLPLRLAARRTLRGADPRL